MNTTSRRDVLKLAAAGSLTTALSTAFGTGAWAQAPAWPTKPVSLLVGYPPGGLTDAGARFLSRGMATALAQPVLVENKPGAGGNIAAAEVQRAGDPYKLLVANTSFTINPHTYPPATPAKNLAEFVAWVKAESAKGFSYASSGNGGNTHLAMEYFRERTGLPKMSQVPYRGSAPAIQDLVGNQVPCMMDAASLLIPFIASGKLRPILVTGSTRLPALADVPTATELGVKDFVVTVFVGLWGPPKMPADMVQKANAALNAALADPAVSGQIVKNGDMVGGGTAQHLAAITRDNYALWGEVARRNNIRAE
jgi:tripartite-type tricarboxylate transporter receptor subunit TctC